MRPAGEFQTVKKTVKYSIAITNLKKVGCLVILQGTPSGRLTIEGRRKRWLPGSSVEMETVGWGGERKDAPAVRTFL